MREICTSGSVREPAGNRWLYSANIFLAEYRGYGISDGEPNLVNFLADAEAIVKAVPSPAHKIILFGRSLGSLQAIHAASVIPGIHAMILESGIANVGDYVVKKVKRLGLLASRMVPDAPFYRSLDREPLRQRLNDMFDHKGKLSRFNGRSLVVCTQDDEQTPAEDSKTLFTWLTGQKVLQVFPRGDHNSIFFENRFTYCRLILDLIRA
jgi:pimeloyl-ACP methyl ester carboxylesterase